VDSGRHNALSFICARGGVADKPRIILSRLPEQSPFRPTFLLNLLRIFHAIQWYAPACEPMDESCANKLLGAATLDRLRHNAYRVVLDGESYRSP